MSRRIRQRILRLPPKLAGALAATANDLAGWSDDTYWMGGGSVLAARWHHRSSTDVDLFYDEGRYDRTEIARVIASLRASAGRRDIALIQIRPHGALWERDGVPVSLFPAPRPAVGTGLDVVSIANGRLVATESSADILTKKVRARMLHNPQYLTRDLYDFVAAHVDEPAAAREAFGRLTHEERAMLSYDANHRDMPAQVGRAIADPAYPRLVGAPETLIRFARLALTGALRDDELAALREMRTT